MAVRAISGTVGKCFPTLARQPYSGLLKEEKYTRSSPVLDYQKSDTYLNNLQLSIRCASSIARRHILPSVAIRMNTGRGSQVTLSINDSGVVNTTRYSPSFPSIAELIDQLPLV